MVGLTVIVVEVSPVLHIYVPSPTAVNVVDPPIQIVLLPLITGVGSG